jgi:hypothetical protein
MLADVLAGENPASGTYPVATVVISGGEEGDRIAGSPEVKVPVGLVESEGLLPRSLKDIGNPPTPKARSGPTGGRASWQVVAEAKQEAPKLPPHVKRTVRILEMPSWFRDGEGKRRRRRNWVHAAVESPGVLECDMPTKSEQRKHGTTRRSPRPAGTAKALPINRRAAKWRRADEWGGWGRLSVDGPGHYNPDRSEGPWGRGEILEQRHFEQQNDSDSEPRLHPKVLPELLNRRAKGGGKLRGATRGRRAGRHRLKAGLEAVLGKTRRTEF